MLSQVENRKRPNSMYVYYTRAAQHRERECSAPQSRCRSTEN